jgi:hypothetical protein
MQIYVYTCNYAVETILLREIYWVHRIMKKGEKDFALRF